MMPWCLDDGSEYVDTHVWCGYCALVYALLVVWPAFLGFGDPCWHVAQVSQVASLWWAWMGRLVCGARVSQYLCAIEWWWTVYKVATIVVNVVMIIAAWCGVEYYKYGIVYGVVGSGHEVVLFYIVARWGCLGWYMHVLESHVLIGNLSSHVLACCWVHKWNYTFIQLVHKCWLCTTQVCGVANECLR